MASSTPSSVRSISPGGVFEVRVVPWEARNSLWVESPCIVDTRTGATVFRFTNGSWSLDRAAWHHDDRVELVLRQYPGDHTPAQLTCTIDCKALLATVQSFADVPLDDVEHLLERLLSWPSRPPGH